MSRGGEIVCLAYFEAQGWSGVAVRRKLEQHIKKLGDDPLVRVETSVVEDVLEEEGFFSCVAEARVSCGFPGFIHLCLEYAPSSLEVLEPKRLEVSREDFLIGLSFCAGLPKKFFSCYGVKLAPPEVVQQKLALAKVSFSDKEDFSLFEDEVCELLSGNSVLVRLVFEARGINKKEVEDCLWRMFQADGCVVLKILCEEHNVGGNGFNGLVSVDLVFSDLELLFECVTRYGPVDLELIEPKVVVLSLRDLFVIGNNLAGLVLDVCREVTEKQLQQ